MMVNYIIIHAAAVAIFVYRGSSCLEADFGLYFLVYKACMGEKTICMVDCVSVQI